MDLKAILVAFCFFVCLVFLGFYEAFYNIPLPVIFCIEWIQHKLDVFLNSKCFWSYTFCVIQAEIRN